MNKWSNWRTQKTTEKCWEGEIVNWEWCQNARCDHLRTLRKGKLVRYSSMRWDWIELIASS